jgi:hypothetical protein
VEIAAHDPATLLKLAKLREETLALNEAHAVEIADGIASTHLKKED